MSEEATGDCEHRQVLERSLSNPGVHLDQSKPTMVIFFIFASDWLRNGHMTGF